MGTKVLVPLWAVLLWNEIGLSPKLSGSLHYTGTYRPSYGWGIGGSEWLRNLPKVTNFYVKETQLCSCSMWLQAHTLFLPMLSVSQSVGAIPQPNFTANQHRMELLFCCWCIQLLSYYVLWWNGEMTEWREEGMDRWINGFMSRWSDLSLIVIWK